jgi:glutathione S-transferase
VPFLITDSGIGMEDSQLVCAYLDSLDGRPRFHPAPDPDWSHRRLETSARSMLDGIAVWAREMARPQGDRSPTTLAHEAARARRMADMFETEAMQRVMQAERSMAQLVLAIALETARIRKLGDLTEGRPRLAGWLTPMSALPSMRATDPSQMRRAQA